MARPIWDKGSSTIDEQIMRFLAGEDIVLDRQLLGYDIEASRAHVAGLQRIGVLTTSERDTLLGALVALAAAFEAGDFVLDERFEDGHSAIESYLVDKLGEVGKKVHTGRSRNDQILVAQRLFLRDALRLIKSQCLEAARVAIARADAGRDVPMPGYTHLQPAVPSSVGMWFAAFAEAFLDDALLAQTTYEWIDSSPLGTAAGYGVNLPLDRDGVAAELGFSRLQINPIYAQNSRGKFEMQVLVALNHCLMDVRRLAWDLSLFTTAEFGFVNLPDQYTTGSSIMPNKRNPDAVELLRAATAPIQGAIAELQSVLSLPSGYHRDLQATKGPVLRAVKSGTDALALVPELLEHLTFDEERLRAAITSQMYATDRAIELTAEGVPFREAYRQVAEELDSFGDRRPEESLRARTSPGATADLLLDQMRARFDALSSKAS